MSDGNIKSDQAPEVNGGLPESATPGGESEGNAAGLRMTDILALPDPLRETITWMIRRREVGLADLAERMGQDETTARSTLAALVQRGYLWETRVGEEVRYRLRLAPQRKRQGLMLDI